MLPVSTSLKKHVLSILDKCTTLNHVKQLQSHLITLGHEKTHLYAFRLIRFCTTRLNDINYARQLFDNFESPNVYIYTALINAYSSVEDHESSAILYRDMIRENRSKPNEFVFSIGLKSWPEVFGSRGVELVQAQAVKSGFGENPVVQAAVLGACVKCGHDVAVARKLFDEMHERNVVAWTAMISGYARVGQIGDAVLLFEKMDDAIRDTPSWNCIITGCIQNGLFSEAIEFFRRMVFHREGCKPNQVTIVCALSALGHSGMLQLGKCIHGYAYRNGLSSDLFVLNGMVDMYGKCGSLDKARLVFDRCTNPNSTFWNTLLNSYALHGRCREAISVLEEMLGNKDEVKPDEVTFAGLLNAFAHVGLVEEGRQYFDMMTEEYGIEPTIEHYGCLIDLLGRAGCFEEAMKIVKGMKVRPDEAIWGSLLNGCKIHRRADLAELFVKKLIEINPENGGYNTMLANLYGEMGKWDEAHEVRKMNLDANAYKSRGCSWIEIENRVHQFYSVDRSHPRAEEIHAALESLCTAKPPCAPLFQS